MEIAVVVNLRARRGSDRVVRACRAAMPGARVLATRSLDEAIDLAAELRRSPPELLVSAGGDGTAVTLLTAMRDAGEPRFDDHPPLAVVPLGTGNGWAGAVGAPGWRRAFENLGRWDESGRAMPLRRFDLVEVCGMVAPFAGTGWDANILDDYHATRAVPWMPRLLREGMPGYFLALATRSVPRAVRARPIEVELTNLGSAAMIIGPDQIPRLLPDAGAGTVLYRGPMSVAGCGTSPDFGFGFRAFPFAGSVPGRFNARVYGAKVFQALGRLPSLWRGVYPLPHDAQWMLDHCRMRFSEPVPFQVGGDRRGLRTEVEFKLAARPVDLLDWHAMRRMERESLYLSN